jgi:hypothetical protein
MSDAPGEPRDDQEEIAIPEERTRFRFGDVLEVLEVGRVALTRRYGCIRRDQYELRAPEPFPEALREALAARGSIRGNAALYVLDVPHSFQLTVAPRAGRALLVPRLSSNAAAQRRDALEVAAVLDAVLCGVEVQL